ncbi:hypothetical protein FB451DRAFT_1563576 [Mycena latifolia]|nr:hypothetical protein FB451DRAFT_1563576 [Mycena latifolia]
MSSLRHRVAFQTGGDDDEGGVPVVLDEQEQDELVASLHAANAQTTAHAVLVLDAVLAFSALLQLVYLLNPSKASPLLALVPLAPSAPPDPDPPLPCPSLFALLALALHANLALHLHPRPQLRAPLAYPLMYALAAVAPTLALFLARSWQTTVWAAVPGLVVALMHSVHATLQEGNEALAELESLKYRAPGP